MEPQPRTCREARAALEIGAVGLIVNRITEQEINGFGAHP